MCSLHGPLQHKRRMGCIRSLRHATASLLLSLGEKSAMRSRPIAGIISIFPSPGKRLSSPPPFFSSSFQKAHRSNNKPSYCAVFCTNGRERMRHGMGKTLENMAFQRHARYTRVCPKVEWGKTVRTRSNKTVGRNETLFSSCTEQRRSIFPSHWLVYDSLEGTAPRHG